ncbi:ATP-binding protein [Ancylobacter defluvii]|uniref:ATP-binding protein n=1 Tax=Ancylobacter defluvii TaxID=1282440 RepID=UPI001FE5908D|nr:ATP-binding protein [Ancylobacter defluvii]
MPILSQLLQAETAAREVRSTAYQPRWHASRPIATSPALASNEVDEALVRQLFRCEFLDDVHNVVLVGRPGTGKPHLATALGVHAIEHHHWRFRLFSTVELVNELKQKKTLGKGHFSRQQRFPLYNTQLWRWPVKTSAQGGMIVRFVCVQSAPGRCRAQRHHSATANSGATERRRLPAVTDSMRPASPTARRCNAPDCRSRHGQERQFRAQGPGTSPIAGSLHVECLAELTSRRDFLNSANGRFPPWSLSSSKKTTLPRREPQGRSWFRRRNIRRFR